MLYLIEQCLNGIQLGMLLFLLAFALSFRQVWGRRSPQKRTGKHGTGRARGCPTRAALLT